jgi:threonyl-tRNA synthetase
MPKCKTRLCWVREEKNGTISIRRHGQEGKGNITVTIEEFVTIVKKRSTKH